MLTSDLIKPRLVYAGATLSISMLDEHSAFWQRTAAELIDRFRALGGQTQADWEMVVEACEGDRVDYLVVRGLAKVLADAATFHPREAPLAPVAIRELLFARGPVSTSPDIFHPLLREEILRAVAEECGMGEEQMETLLFADRPAEYVLTDVGPAWTPEGLLARYNLELARGVLYWATHLRIEVADHYKDLWRYLKLFKLMCWAQPMAAGGYRLDLDGPISPFVSATTRYGRAFAAFFPALLLCEQWQMTAAIRPPQSQRVMTYRLDHRSPLRSHFRSSGLFDSQLERDFAAEFEEKFGEARGKWTLAREDEVLLLGDTVMIPDFTLIDRDDPARRILVELVGYWHPEYLRRKVAKVRAARCRHLLLLVYEGVNLSDEHFQDVPGEVLYFQQKPVLKEVLAAVERMAEEVYGKRLPKERAPKKKAGRKDASA